MLYEVITSQEIDEVERAAGAADQIHVITSYSIHYTKLYELVEGGANLHHAQLQGRVAYVFDQALHHLGGFQKFGDAGLEGAEIDACASDDQLADEVDVLIEFVGIDLGW